MHQRTAVKSLQQLRLAFASGEKTACFSETAQSSHLRFGGYRHLAASPTELNQRVR